MFIFSGSKDRIQEYSTFEQMNETKESWMSSIYSNEQAFTNDKLLTVFKKIKQDFSLLDVGCGNGYFILDAIRKGNSNCVGIDGNHHFDIEEFKGFLWKNYPNNCFVCDFRQPFEIKKENKIFRFDFITSWEHLEHMPEDSLDTWLTSTMKHSYSETRFIFSISSRPDKHHPTIKEKSWWSDKFKSRGLVLDNNFMNRVNGLWVRQLHDSHYFVLKND